MSEFGDSGQIIMEVTYPQKEWDAKQKMEDWLKSKIPSAPIPTNPRRSYEQD